MTFNNKGDTKVSDDFLRIRNSIKDTLINNDMIDEYLHVVAVISNPCQYKKRIKLAKEFIFRMEREKNVILYLVELSYNGKYQITEKNNNKHLQLKAEHPIWAKENMINLGVEKLLPKDWKAVAWIDADIEFENVNWSSDTLKILNGYSDVVQLFSHAIDMDQSEQAMSIFSSFGFQYSKGVSYKHAKTPVNYWHPGYAWACTRKTWNKIGGTYENSILGSSDHLMALAFIGRAAIGLNKETTKGYLDDLLNFEHNSKNLRLGYVPGVIRHYFHGSKVNRKYVTRWQILIKYHFDPLVHIKRNSQGILVPTSCCPTGMLKEIKEYFWERNEDE
jgi:hypothetical protein